MRRILPITVIVAALASPAAAYVRSTDSRTEACLFWTTRDIHWALNDNGAADVDINTLEQAMLASFQAWEDVECSDVRFTYDGRTSMSDVGFDPDRTDNVNLMVWQENDCGDPGVVPEGDPCRTDPDPFACPNAYHCWSHSSSVIALTTANYNVHTGVVVDVDIEFNGRSNFTAHEETNLASCGVSDPPCTGTDVRNTATHEVGHFIGLGHTTDPDATMYANAGVGETKKRSLEDDDINGLCAIYPSGEPPATCTPSGRISIAQTSAYEGGGCSTEWAGLPALLSLMAARRRRRDGAGFSGSK